MKKTLKEIIREVSGARRLEPEVKRRLAEFKAFRRKGGGDLFPELCYCLMTANARADAAWNTQAECGSALRGACEAKLAKTFLRQGVRFHNTKAKRVCEARRLAPNLRKIVYSFKDGVSAREWLVANVKGLGWKEASHFLRNVGFFDVAILDRHILRAMREAGLIEEVPRALSKKLYLRLEDVLRKEARKLGLSLGELDLILWASKTGKVLK